MRLSRVRFLNRPFLLASEHVSRDHIGEPPHGSSTSEGKEYGHYKRARRDECQSESDSGHEARNKVNKFETHGIQTPVTLRSCRR